MRLEKYGIVLKRVTYDKIELIRTWRNDSKISQYMEYKEYITPEMQEIWFQKINNDNNYFFIIEYDGKEIGLINLKDIDYNKKEAESGIFIFDDEYLNTDVPVRASFCLGDFIFETLELEQEIIHVLRDNKRAVKYNLQLGFELLPNQEHVNNQCYKIDKAKYFKKRTQIIRLLK